MDILNARWVPPADAERETPKRCPARLSGQHEWITSVRKGNEGRRECFRCGFPEPLTAT